MYNRCDKPTHIEGGEEEGVWSKQQWGAYNPISKTISSALLGTHILRHGKNRECGLTLPACLEGVDIGEFGDGKKLLKETLNARLPSLIQHTPKQDWLNRYCHFGNLECSYREAHPQAHQWGRQKIHIHVSDGANTAHIDCSDFRDMIEEDVIYRFNDLEFTYLDSLTCPQGCKFLLCSRCQEVRSSPFAIYRITPHTSADTFIAIGMSIALEKQFTYPITKILITNDEDNIPSLLKGYEIIVERNYTRIKDRLNLILPEMIEKTRQTTWKPQSLPFEVFLPTKEYAEPEETTSTEVYSENDTQVRRDEGSSSQQETEKVQDIGQTGHEQARDRFDKFTEGAKKVLSLAQEEALLFQHNYIGTEHLLLGLIREGKGVAAKVLAHFGVELNEVRSAAESIIDREDRLVLGKIGLTPRSRQVIELAIDEARRWNHHYIGTEHLLLGLLREGEGIGVDVLKSIGVRLETVRDQTIRLLSQASVSAIVDTLQQETEKVQDIGQTGHEQARDRFDKFTEGAKKVLSLAQEEAKRLQHNYIGTEHLLLGLVREGEGVAAKVLAHFGVELNKVRSAVEFIIGRGDRIVLGEIRLTPRAKKVMELAAHEVRSLNHSYVGTEHLLLGLVREREVIGAGILEYLGVNLERVRARTIRVLG